MAVAASDMAIAINPNDAEVRYNRGNANRDLGRLRDALRDYDPPSASIPASPRRMKIVVSRWGNWGMTHQAVLSHERAVALRPAEPGSHYNLGLALRAAGRSAACAHRLRSLPELDPDNVAANANRAIALCDLGRTEEALADLTAAIARRPGNADLLYNRGVTLENAYRYEEALIDYESALATRQDFPECANNLGLTLLLLGRYEGAWSLRERRFDVREFHGVRRAFTQPRWLGEPLHGRTLLIHAEQGFGDALQFCRYAEQIEGGTVILEARRP